MNQENAADFYVSTSILRVIQLGPALVEGIKHEDPIVEEDKISEEKYKKEDGNGRPMVQILCSAGGQCDHQ